MKLILTREIAGLGLAGDIVEVADGYTGLVPVRDSKTPASRPLVFSAGSWLALVDLVRGDEGA